MQTRPYTNLRRGVLAPFSGGPRERTSFQYWTSSFCVVTCVVTLASLPVSGAVGCCHSGTGEGQETAGKPA
jgi:hypothetical protein